MSGTVPVNGLQGITGSIGIPETILQNNIPVPEPQIQPAGFSELLKAAVSNISETQLSADTAIEKLAAGQNVELHNVMIAAQKASLTLQLALQVKNKITEAYQEIMRMQI